MPTFTLMVMANPTFGMEQEFNDWYNEEHLSQVLTTPSFITARRLKVHEGYEDQFKYVALYEIETDDPHAAVSAVMFRAENEWGHNPAFGRSRLMLFENLTPLVRSGEA